jgi:hypothetical protein
MSALCRSSGFGIAGCVCARKKLCAGKKRIIRNVHRDAIFSILLFRNYDRA